MPIDPPDPGATRTFRTENRFDEIRRSVGSDMRQIKLAKQVPRAAQRSGILGRVLASLVRVFTG